MLHFASFFGFPLCFVLFAIHTPVTANFQLPNLDLFTEVAFPKLTLHPQADAFDFDLETALPPASSSLVPLGALPTACAPYEGPGNECTTGMAATAVTFEDCGAAFTVCRCADAVMTMNTVVDRLGRVPVGLRRFLGTVLVLGGQTHAYTNLTTGDVHLFGDCAMDTWVHETAHAFDYAVPTAPHSNSVGWEKATLQDSCVPDDYALTNQVEDFAQMTVIKTYMLLHSGNLPPGFQSACMQNQLRFLSTLSLFNATSLFGNTCAIDDEMPGARRQTGPKILDATRTFKTVPLDSALPLRTSEALANSGVSQRHRQPISNWIGLLIVLSSTTWTSGWLV